MSAKPPYEARVNAEVAREWLQSEGEYNRPSDETTVRDYARDMASGDWTLSESAIVFDVDGKLMNGGNRLRAVIVASEARPDIEVPFWVIEGMPRDAYKVMDIGKKRNAANQAHAMTNGVYSGKSMPLVKWYWQYTMGNPMGRVGRWSASPTRSQELRLFASDPNGFENSWERGKDLVSQKLGNKATGALFHHLLMKTPQIGSEVATSWFDSLVSGANLSDGSPILALRNRLMTGRDMAHGARIRPYTRQEQLYLYHRAWRAYCQDETIGRLVLPALDTGLSNANFPKLWIPGVSK